MFFIPFTLLKVLISQGLEVTKAFNENQLKLYFSGNPRESSTKEPSPEGNLTAASFCFLWGEKAYCTYWTKKVK